MRRDARRNREQLITAARELFAERGVDVPLEEIARRARVSIGTLYNRFPTRGHLVDAVFADRVAASVRIAEAALDMDDPWQALVLLLEQTCELQAADLGYNDVVSRALPLRGAAEQARARGYELMRQVIVRAQEAAVLRADITLEDMAFVLWGHARTVEATAAVAPRAWRRHLAIMLDGLRAEAAHPLPEPPLRPDQARQALSGQCAAEHDEPRAPGDGGPLSRPPGRQGRAHYDAEQQS
ncbi:TetR/AcrR family transcriptional regulator [Frankia sp. CH37]|nr:TetR/AcrR family transcriptional regulator [Parafrankia sp. CH37]